MSTEVFLGGLATLILVAVIIVAMTTNNEGNYSNNTKDRDEER